MPPARHSDMPDLIVESGTAEAVAFRLMEKVLALHPELNRREELLKLYAECLATVRGPVAQDLLEALNFEG